MKKSLLILSVLFCLKGFSQSSIQVTDMANSATIAPNGTVAAITTATGSALDFDVKNISASTKSYHVKRYDIILHTVASATASAHFCFAGSCYGDNIFVSQTPLSLNAGQSASEIQGINNIITADLDEANNIVGYSVVKYTVFNAANTSDSLQFTIRYNGPAGISELNNNVFSSLELFPNPATDATVLKVTSLKAMDAKVIIYNALGSVVSEKQIVIAEGKNKIDLNINDLNSGVYFTQIKMANSSLTKRLIVK